MQTQTYILSYHGTGECRRVGLVSRPELTSHIASGSAHEFHEDIDLALHVIRHSFGATSVIGYAHSTGAPLLLDYLMERGDGAFDSFVFNSPFLDWGWVGGPLSRLAVLWVPSVLSEYLRLYSRETALLPGGSPNAWAAILWSQVRHS